MRILDICNVCIAFEFYLNNHKKILLRQLGKTEELGLDIKYIKKLLLIGGA